MGGTPADDSQCLAAQAAAASDEESDSQVRCLQSSSGSSRSCTALGARILADPSITLASWHRRDIEYDLCTPNVIHWEVKRGLLQIAKAWKLFIVVLKTGHGYDSPHGHSGGWAADIGNYTARNYAQTTAFMIWLNRNHTRLIIRQIIGANEKWVYPNTPGYYNRKTLNDHKDHVHIGWGYWP